MRRRVWVALVLVAALALGQGQVLQAAEPGQIDGDLPSSGVALVVWGGGTVSQLEAAAENGGCTLRSAWVFVGGRPVGHLPGAPAFVNAAFLGQFPGGEVPASTTMVLLCGTASPPGGGGAPSDIAFQAAFGGRTFERAVELVAYPGGRFLLAEQGGRVLLLEGSSASTFLDLSVRREGNEEGLLSLALDPQFASTGHVWAYYSVQGGERRTRLSRFTVEGDSATPSSELTVLEVPQPYSNHNGGAVRFGPDGMLYLGLGDGGSGGDPHGNGQNRNTLLGSVLRLDVRSATAAQPYVIPSSNPYASGGGRGEVWAYGFRNPWRMAFDGNTGDLWVGDVGQGAVEEIDVVTRGGNFGWNRLEGDRCYQDGCSTSGTVLPVATYTHNEGCSVTGGVVARGSGVPEVEGAYLFADYCSGIVWAMPADSRGEAVEVGRVDGSPTSFTIDGNGRIYLVQSGGPVLRIVSP